MSKKPTNKDLLAQIAEQDAEAAKAMAKENKAVLQAWLDAAEEAEDGEPKRTMAGTLQKYRTRYEDCVSYTSRLSKNNGDEVAKLLAGAAPANVVRAAEKLLGLEDGELVARYASLNPGQQRMNAGNRIRAAIKRGDATIDDLTKAFH